MFDVSSACYPEKYRSFKVPFELVEKDRAEYIFEVLFINYMS